MSSNRPSSVAVELHTDLSSALQARSKVALAISCAHHVCKPLNYLADINVEGKRWRLDNLVPIELHQYFACR